MELSQYGHSMNEELLIIRDPVTSAFTPMFQSGAPDR